jgi:hypothetical protein
MAWDNSYSNFGVLKIDGSKVKVYKDRYNYKTITVNKSIVNAIWAGGELNITLADGKVRRYKDLYNYKAI